MPEGSDNKTTPEPATVAPTAAQGKSDSALAFISFASADRSTANAVCRALERAGVRCWIAPRDVTPGELYAPHIVHAIDTARVVVLVLSQHSAESAHVLREVERGSSKRHPIIAFRIDLAPLPEGLEYFLNSSQWLDASTTGVHRALPKLVDAVKSVLAKPSSAAPVSPGIPITKGISKRSNRMVLAVAAVLAMGLSYVIVDRFWLSKRLDTQTPIAATKPASVIPAKSIAVLPFVNISSDKEQEYFSDGLSEELLNLLAKIPQLRVAARTSSFYYKGKDIKVTDVARELNVTHLLEGSVRKSGSRVRVTAQLIRASDGYHQWSETYDRVLEDVFAVQEEIAAAVVSQLKIRLLSPPPKARQTKPEAYALYLQALQLQREGTGRYDDRIALYEQALAIDPNYAPAWIGLGRNYWAQADFGSRPLAAGMEKARETYTKALAIDSEYGQAHAGLGWIALTYDHDLSAAAAHYQRALALDPADPEVLGMAIGLSWALGRSDSLLEVADYLVSRDPLSPDAYFDRGEVHWIDGRLDDAIANYRLSLELSPDANIKHHSIGDCLLHKGDYEAALAEYKKEPREPLRLAGLASVYHSLGRASQSDAALAELVDKYPTWPTLTATTLVHRGQHDNAFAYLGKAVANRESSVAFYPSDPKLTQLHDDPRWLPFMRKLGKAPEQLAAIKFELNVPTH